MKPFKMKTREGMAPVTLAVNQPPYLPLRINRVELSIDSNVDENGIAFSEWEPTEEEARILANGGRVELAVWTMGNKFPPVRITAIESDTSRRLQTVAPSVDWNRALTTATTICGNRIDSMDDHAPALTEEVRNLCEAFKLLFAGRTIRSTFAEPKE